MKKQLFTYAVLFHQHEEKEGKLEYKETLILVEPKVILAKNSNEVAFKATRDVPEQYAGFSENVEIIVRPFK
jgi:hypothetical protein